MTTIACKGAGNQTDQIEVAAGVDTHQDTHTAAVIDRAGRLLGHRQFQATRRGYVELLAWLPA
jgi:transposase